MAIHRWWIMDKVVVVGGKEFPHQVTLYHIPVFWKHGPPPGPIGIPTNGPVCLSCKAAELSTVQSHLPRLVQEDQTRTVETLLDYQLRKEQCQGIILNSAEWLGLLGNNPSSIRYIHTLLVHSSLSLNLPLCLQVAVN
jgi:hypothetical protein